MVDLYLPFTRHQRYQNGIPVMGEQFCGRAFSIQNKDFGEVLKLNGQSVKPKTGFLVRLINTDINQDNMMPKFMEIVSDDGDAILLKGVSLEIMGMKIPSVDHKDYGIKLILKDRKVFKTILYMFDRNISIEYYN